MAAPALRLSKSRFTTGLQCHKRLWWTVHEPDAPELVPDAGLQARFDRGTRVGEVARTHVPGGVLIDLPHTELEARVEATRRALAEKPPAIYEASFFENGVFVSVDILERTGGGYGVVEVKSTSKLKDQHLSDAAIQANVVRAAGVPVEHVHVMHLNPECVHPRLENLFARADVTETVQVLDRQIGHEVARQLETLAGPLPQVGIGDHCSTPYECPFMGRCWPERPEHHVSTLYYVGRKASQLVALGCERVHDVPEDFPLVPAARRQVMAVRSGRMVIEKSLARALVPFVSPLAFLDFETVAPAIPVWNGCRPYDAIPVQFSCFVEDGAGGHLHYEWLAEESGDPRRALARALVEACAGASRVVVYNSTFEKRCLERLADGVPEHRAGLQSIRERLVDLLPVVRDHVYHPGFGGSFSIKRVLPALVPALGYHDLAIPDGDAASRALEQLLLEPERFTPETDAELRANLLAYCRLDTWAMVELLAKLRQLAAD